MFNRYTLQKDANEYITQLIHEAINEGYTLQNELSFKTYKYIHYTMIQDNDMYEIIVYIDKTRNREKKRDLLKVVEVKNDIPMFYKYFEL